LQYDSHNNNIAVGVDDVGAFAGSKSYYGSIEISCRCSNTLKSAKHYLSLRGGLGGAMMRWV